MTRILLTGATGQVGLESQRLLATRTFEVLAPARGELDLETPETLRDQVVRLRPDAIINCAAFTAVDAAETSATPAFRINADAPGALAEAARELDAPLVHISTDYVFDGDKSCAYVETDPVHPLGVYGRSKAEGEARVLAAGARSAILRTSWVFSPHRGNFVKTMLRLGETREEIGVVDDQWGKPTAAADIAEAALALAVRLMAADPASSGVFHYAGAGEACWADFAEAIFEGASRRGRPQTRVRRIPTSEFPTPTRRPANSRLDTSRIETLGVKVRPWREALEICLNELLGPPTLRTAR
jgi:dTDP-4-dehydrorhamnose reductase